MSEVALNPLECALNEAQALRRQVDELLAENAELRDVEKSRRWIAQMLGEQTARVVNLQELVRDMFDGMCDHDHCYICSHWQEGYNGCEYHVRMREMGVES